MTDNIPERPCPDFKSHLRDSENLNKYYEEKLEKLKMCCTELEEIKLNQDKIFTAQGAVNETLLSQGHTLNTILEKIGDLSRNTMTKPQIENMLLRFSENYVKTEDIDNIKVAITEEVMDKIRILGFKVIGLGLTLITIGISFLGLTWFIAKQIFHSGLS